MLPAHHANPRITRTDTVKVDLSEILIKNAESSSLLCADQLTLLTPDTIVYVSESDYPHALSMVKCPGVLLIEALQIYEVVYEWLPSRFGHSDSFKWPRAATSGITREGPIIGSGLQLVIPSEHDLVLTTAM